MLFETVEPLKLPVERSSSAGEVKTPLPAGVALTERAVADLRAWLARNHLSHYLAFFSTDFDLHDVEDHLEQLGEADAAWEPPPAMIDGGEPMPALAHENDRARYFAVGFLYLRRYDVVIMRRYWLNDDDFAFRGLWMCAAASTGHYDRLRQAVRELRHDRGQAVWQIVRGEGWRDAPDRARAGGGLAGPAAQRSGAPTR